jgi:hypothetical protein
LLTFQYQPSNWKDVVRIDLGAVIEGTRLAVRAMTHVTKTAGKRGGSEGVVGMLGLMLSNSAGQRRLDPTHI